MSDLFQNLLTPSVRGQFLELSVGLDEHYSYAFSELFHFDEMGQNEFQLGKVNSVLDVFVEEAREKRLCYIRYKQEGDETPFHILCPLSEAQGLLDFLDPTQLSHDSDGHVGWFDWGHRAFVLKDFTTFFTLMRRAGLNKGLGDCPALDNAMQYSPDAGATYDVIARELQFLSDGLQKPIHFEYNAGHVQIDVVPAPI